MADAVAEHPEPGPEPASSEPTTAEKTKESQPKPGRIAGHVKSVVFVVGVILLAILLRTFVVAQYYIPSDSMVPTLKQNDRIFVNKLSYRLHDVHRGDVVVFNRPPAMPSDPKIKHLIKRVVGLPGDTLETRNGEVYVNGQRLVEPYLPKGTVSANLIWVKGCTNAVAERFCTVPEGSVFVMGDNRGSSSDSRAFGPIDESLIVGRAFVRVWPLGDFGGL